MNIAQIEENVSALLSGITSGEFEQATDGWRPRIWRVQAPPRSAGIVQDAQHMNNAVRTKTQQQNTVQHHACATTTTI